MILMIIFFLQLFVSPYKTNQPIRQVLHDLLHVTGTQEDSGQNCPINELHDRLYDSAALGSLYYVRVKSESSNYIFLWLN